MYICMRTYTHMHVYGDSELADERSDCAAHARHHSLLPQSMRAAHVSTCHANFTVLVWLRCRDTLGLALQGCGVAGREGRSSQSIKLSFAPSPQPDYLFLSHPSQQRFIVSYLTLSGPKQQRHSWAPDG